MHEGRYDFFNRQLLTNPLTPDLTFLKINETSFFPTLEIQKKDFNPEHDIMGKDGKIDLEKLKNYMEMAVSVR